MTTHLPMFATGLLLAFTAGSAMGQDMPTVDAEPRGRYDVPPVKNLDELRRAAPPLFIGNWDQAASSSAIFRMGWNADGLTILAEVFDDQVRVAGGTSRIWNGDSIEVYLDVRPAGAGSAEYIGDPSGLVGQIGLAPQPASEAGEAPVVVRGSGDLRNVFELKSLARGYRRTDTGYEIWLTIPAGDWLKPGRTVLADLTLNDHGDDVGGKYFAFGEDFNWKTNSRFGELRIVDRAAAPAHMASTSTMGVAGRAGSMDAYEDIECVAFSDRDPAEMTFTCKPADAQATGAAKIESRLLGEHRLYRLRWQGRNSSDTALRFTLTGPSGDAAIQRPATLSQYKALLRWIAAEQAAAPRDHMCRMMYEIAREDVLCSMLWHNLTGDELTAAITRHITLTRQMRDGRSNEPMQIYGYYSPGQKRWLPFAVRQAKPASGKPTGVEISLHGSSGFDFTRGAFVRRMLKSNEVSSGDASRAQRTQVFLYGAGNDYRRLGQDDWQHVPAMLRDLLDIDPADVHLRGHSMGGGATYYFGTRIPGLSPALPFKTFTPAAASSRVSDVAGQSYDDFVQRRDSTQALAANLHGRPFLLVHGVEDRVVPVERSRQSLAWLKSIGNPVDILEIPAQGHGPRGYEELREIWLARQKPQPITQWTAYELRFAEANGAAVLAFEQWAKPATVHFAGDSAINTENVAVLDLAAWPGKWPVVVNGQTVTKQAARWTVDDSFGGNPATTRAFKTRANCGPIREVARRGFVVVAGTQVPERRELLLTVARHIRDAILRTEWGMKEDDLKIYRDTDRDIPGDTCVIVVGDAEENAYAAKRAGDAEALAQVAAGAGAERAGIWLLRPDRHLLVRGGETFYRALLTRGSRSLLPGDADWQVWEAQSGEAQPAAEGEFDVHWEFDNQLMRKSR